MWPFKKKKKKVISRDRFLQSRAVHNPALKWEESDDGVITLMIPRSKSGISSFLGRSLSLPEYKQVKLDEIGSKVWKKMDGKTDARALVDWMNQEFKMSPREAEMALGIYLEKLSDRGYIVLMVPLPEPGTQEAKEEAIELRKQLKDLENDFKRGRVKQEDYSSIKQEMEKRLELMGEKSG